MKKGFLRYTPTESGFAIREAKDPFNRMLYGSHKNDDKPLRYVTFSGDAPQVMGAATDWTVNDYCQMAKRGTLFSGLTMTLGHRIGGAVNTWEAGAKWFHEANDVCAEFKPGWFEYELTEMSMYFPHVEVKMETYPLHPEDGFLVHYKIKSDQRIVFVAGFGGITDYFTDLTNPSLPARYFHASDCADNTIELGENRACVRHTCGATMHIGTTFPAKFELGSAKSMEENSPALFSGSTPESAQDGIVKITAVVEQGQELDGYIVAIHNSDEKTLDEWLTRNDPAKYVRQQIYAKRACMNLSTPEKMYDLTIPPAVIAMDSAFHGNSFQHATFTYHSPYLGWRNWYGPTILGWDERMEIAMSTRLDDMVKEADGEEKVYYLPRSKSTGHKTAYHRMENPRGFIPYFLGSKALAYNMQECAFDMMMYHVEWSGNLEFAKKYFDEFSMILDFEERIFDPDHDGLYQNFLNTWISDGHFYNGAGCAQASAYNYRANVIVGKIAEKLGLPNDKFVKRAEKIKKAVQEKLWFAETGVIAESIDTMGHCLVHPSPELSTTYLAIDCGLVDEFQAYTMLKYTENYIRSTETPGRGGRLCYSSNWYPRKYSSCIIAPAENAHLALTYFQTGLKEKGQEILDGLSDCYFQGVTPGQTTQAISVTGTDEAEIDYADVSSTYLRLAVEGLFGIRMNKLDGYVMIAPNLPDEWDHADLTIPSIALHYRRTGNQEIYEIYCDREDKKYIKVPMKTNGVDMVMVDGEQVPYEVIAAPNNCFVMVEVDKVGHFQFCVHHSDGVAPSLKYANEVLAGNEMAVAVCDGEILEVKDMNGTLTDIAVVGNKVYAKATGAAGYHTLFVRVKEGEYDAWLAADYEILKREEPKLPCATNFEPVDITEFFNCKMEDIHNQDYDSPRPEGFSIGVLVNGRSAWEWNQCGRNKVAIDDSMFRTANGIIRTNSGIPFMTPAENENVACVTQWDRFPTEMSIPLSGNGKEVALLFVMSTNSMQTQVEHIRFTVTYADGTTEVDKLVYPFNVDDWMTPALQTENETFYFSEYNHAIVQRISVDPTKELASVKIEAIANEIVMGLVGVSIGK